MSAGKPFFDTNVLLYLLSEDEAKAEKAEGLLRARGTISVQVLNEFTAVALRKAKRSWPEIHHLLATIRAACRVVPLTTELHDEGLRVAERYGFTIYDSLIVAAAVTSDCNLLYSEDMQDKQVIGDRDDIQPFQSGLNMSQDSIDKVLQSRRPTETPVSETADGKFFSILVGETTQEHFLELRFRIGLKTCFSYTDLLWFNYDPEANCIDLEFGGYQVTLKGRGLGGKLFNGLKQKRVAWVQEADSEMEDHKGNETFIEEIAISPPSSGSAETGEPAA